MSKWSGGCLCGQLHWTAEAAPDFMGHCYCGDCRKASGSGFIPFMSYGAGAVRITGESRRFLSKSFRGGDAVRNSCPVCGGLVFGGTRGQDETLTIYAGTLDDATLFQPRIALFNRGRPDWATLPDGLTVFETMPPG
jgi:hypothetical protein